MRVEGTTLVAGTQTGTVLRLDEPLSFWGGIDSRSGEIIDRAHPQCGQTLSGRVLVLPGSRGSSGTPAVLGELLRCRAGPKALVLPAPDINLVTGALIAEALYGISCPVVVALGKKSFDASINAKVQSWPNTRAGITRFLKHLHTLTF